jgi:hypothetical protein
MFVGMVETQLGNLSTAEAAFREALEVFTHLQERWATAWLFEGWSSLEVARGQPARAVRIAGAATVLREMIGAPASPADAARLDPALAQARQALGQLEYAAAWAEGRAMTLEQAATYLLAER